MTKAPVAKMSTNVDLDVAVLVLAEITLVVIDAVAVVQWDSTVSVDVVWISTNVLVTLVHLENSV